MNSTNQDALRRAMEEVAVLPPGHPQREQTLRQVEAAGTWARDAWAEMLKEDEQCRLELRDVEPPVDLTQRLKAIPDQAAQSTRLRLTRRRAVGAIAAACLLLVGLLGINLWPDEPDPERVMQDLVRLAVQDHRDRPELTVASSQPHRIESHLQGGLTFPVRVPPMEQGFSLVGGRICSFDRHPIAHTRWQEGAREHSLYQLAAADFRLSPDFTPRKLEIPATPEHPQRYEVLIWSSGHCVYVMVCERPA